jgi:signal transduction histidine kinase
VHDQKVLDEKKDEFIALASHELKTPLTSAKAYAELLEEIVEEKKDGDLLSYAKKTNLFLNRLNELISELLDITKIQYGKLQFNMSEFDFDSMLNEAIECTRQSSSRHQINKTGEPINWPTKGDKDRLQQVCVNILSNAVKYSPKANQVDVKVTSDSGEIVVAVTDYGIGIPKSDLDKVFQRFYRVDGKAEQFQGLGIGLYISAEIVRRHHGKIWVESEYGKGSTFYFTLPIASAGNGEEPVIIKNNMNVQRADSITLKATA